MVRRVIGGSGNKMVDDEHLKDYANFWASQVPDDTRDPFGNELGDPDRRRYGLRDQAGYRGWLDNDGYPVRDEDADWKGSRS